MQRIHSYNQRTARKVQNGEQAVQSLIGRWRVQTTEHYSDYCSGVLLLLLPLLHAAYVTATISAKHPAGDTYHDISVERVIPCLIILMQIEQKTPILIE